MKATRDRDAQGEAQDRAMLDLAARAALRAEGLVEPNPLVGCVLADAGGRVLAVAHHQRFGGPHAERLALALCAARGLSARGATAWVTLEPCRHTGKQPPCTDALLESGVREVVFARADPNPPAAGGAALLAGDGVLVRSSAASPLATSLATPFIVRCRERRPFVIAKWAVTHEGGLVPPPGRKYLSSPTSLRAVHRMRGRVDAVIVGARTLIADDALLTVRHGPPARRIPRRIVLDPSLSTPPTSSLVRAARAPGAGEAILVRTDAAPAGRAEPLARAGCTVLRAEAGADGRIDLRAFFALLGSLEPMDGARAIATVLVEPGPTLLRALLAADLPDEARVIVADARTMPDDAVLRTALRSAPGLAGHRACRVRRLGPDAMLISQRLGV